MANRVQDNVDGWLHFPDLSMIEREHRVHARELRAVIHRMAEDEGEAKVFCFFKGLPGSYSVAFAW